MLKKIKGRSKGLRASCKHAVGKMVRHSKKDGFFMRVWKSIYK